jgi:hypothetical protein
MNNRLHLTMYIYDICMKYFFSFVFVLILIFLFFCFCPLQFGFCFGFFFFLVFRFGCACHNILNFQEFGFVTFVKIKIVLIYLTEVHFKLTYRILIVVQ